MLITLRGKRVKILESQPPLPKKEHQKTKKQNQKKTAVHSRRAQIYTNWDRICFFDELQIG